ncbi:hypothetical protein BACT_1171 [Bifidobacterium actinocoloniiforme DSM 22766]|uniref:Tmp1 n=1 Tax=Bifidobacterium actinocoloniiforme DSM 22766 TaxID=1437605 RepID=A0A086Z1R7_9BIFI|nr:DUF4391 domain-containing protein [Bifidobacterium actinocoloniiforme]AKV55579.1 hypothetical protein AB656_04470 [Bifidobacterium actinocoloniiforme DSM 22766]KFI40467.1 hypothetical protein BACT_1171 [Bifidobacterium actinocoloniiforme DSM 22766]
MTAQACGSVSALTLGLPPATAVPEGKGELPKQMFYAKRPTSARLKQRFTNDLRSVTMLALLRPADAGLAPGEHVQEILVMGLDLTCEQTPLEIVDRIAGMRSSRIVFACVRQSREEGGQGDECALAVRRPMPTKPGHEPAFRVFASPWKPSGQVKLTLSGANMDKAWEGLSAQVILGEPEGADLDARIARRDLITELVAEEVKLSKDHARAKDPTQRNQVYAKLHKVRSRLKELGSLDGAGAK